MLDSFLCLTCKLSDAVWASSLLTPSSGGRTRGAVLSLGFLVCEEQEEKEQPGSGSRGGSNVLSPGRSWALGKLACFPLRGEAVYQDK